MDPFTLGLIGAGLGAFGGGSANQQSQTTSLNLGSASEAEKFGGQLSMEQLKQLQQLIGAGPGQQDVEAGLGAQRGLAEMLQGLTKTGGLPGQEDISAARGFAADIFAPERQAVTSGFAGQEQQARQRAAQQGRSFGSDPILQARLATAQQQQLGGIGARQTAFGAQQAQNMPLQRLQFAGQLADVRGGLASQALANRQALAGMGQALQGAERNFRIQSAGRTTTGTSGGGTGQAIAGALGGFSSFARVGGMFQGLDQNQQFLNMNNPSNIEGSGSFIGPMPQSGGFSGRSVAPTQQQGSKATGFLGGSTLGAGGFNIPYLNTSGAGGGAPFNSSRPALFGGN